MQKNNNLNIVTDPEFSGIIPPIPSRDFDLLEQQVLRDGCTDPLIVWKFIDDVMYLIVFGCAVGN